MKFIEILNEVLNEVIKKKASQNAYGAIYDQMDDIKQKMYSEWRSGKYKLQPWGVVPASRLIKVWKDFSATGIVKDERTVEDIISKFTENLIRLHYNNILSGHEQTDPLEEFPDEFEDEEEMQPFIDWAVILPSGEFRISDYGINKLFDNLALTLETNDYNEKIVYLDMFLNVAHQRSDLASWFVEGGSKTLSSISLQGDEYKAKDGSDSDHDFED